MSYLVSKKHERAIHTMRIFYTFLDIKKFGTIFAMYILRKDTEKIFYL